MSRELRVLLVEDNEDDAALVLEHLRVGGYAPRARRVFSADAMREALAAEEWDVIISDHRLPRFSSIDALLLLIDSGKDIPFIIVSGTIGEELAVEAMKAGAADFVMKGSLGKLVPAVDNAVHAAETRRARARAELETRESREQLRRLTSHLETVREQERARIAREIHDDLGGILTALKMDISWLHRRCEAQPEVGDKLRAMTELSDGAIKTMRRIITDLRPSVLDDLGLVAAIEWQVREFRNRMGIKAVLDLGLDPDVSLVRFDERIAVAAFRILQESLTNVARHAAAQRVEVAVAIEGADLVLTVQDDGRGLTPQPDRRPGSYGILGMHERARHLGGSLEISGAPGEGTRVRLALPLHPAEEEWA